MKYKMKTNLKLFILTLIFTAVTACEKDAHSHHKVEEIQQEDLKIEYILPEPNSTYKNGEELIISGNIICNHELHGYQVSIVGKCCEKTEYFRKSKHSHGKELMFYEKWTVSVEKPETVYVLIDVAIDHEGTTVTDTLVVNLVP
jgi:hypothetical protein